jgi:phosphopantothenoylcysteine decarboxylase/phosphopantothenate--cysteine ligase
MSAPVTSVTREIILGVGGGISAYKSCDLLRRLQEHGFLVSVIPTRNSYNFVGKSTWEALSGRAVHDDLWNNVQGVPHVKLAKQAEAIVIAPATADLIAKLATGRADDLLTNVVAASTSPLVLVPAMHTEMWLNPSTVQNVATLRSRGVLVVEPESGKLTSGDTGVGRYPEVSSILDQLSVALKRNSDLLGKKVLVSAGGTREAIDPVRFIGNHSSGKQGIAVALDAVTRGARVTLVLANQPDVNIEGITTFHVSSTLELQSAIEAEFDSSDIVVMTAAVADARPISVSTQKIATEDYQRIDLTENPDIIAELASRKTHQFVIGFAAQTSSDALEIAKNKLESKKLDLIYVNDVSEGKVFGHDETQGSILTKDGEIYPCETMSKKTLAHKLLSIALDKLG